jgi:hypothetical protein
MHDVLKPTTLNEKQKRWTRWIWAVLFTVLFVVAVVGLILIKTAMMIVVIVAVNALIIWFRPHDVGRSLRCSHRFPFVNRREGDADPGNGCDGG